MKSLIVSVSVLSQLLFTLAGPPIDTKCLTYDSSCLTAKVQAITKFIADGIPRLGKEELDPIYIDSLNIYKNDIKMQMTKRQIKGMNNVVVDAVSIDVSPRVLRILFHTDFSAANTYIINGSLFSMPIYGEGDYFITLNNVQIDMVISFNITKDATNGDVIDLGSYQYTFDVKDVKFSLDNLYYGDKKSSDKMHELLNQNWKMIFNQYGSYLFDKIIGTIFNSIRNYTFSRSLDTIV